MVKRLVGVCGLAAVSMLAPVAGCMDSQVAALLNPGDASAGPNPQAFLDDLLFKAALAGLHAKGIDLSPSTANEAPALVGTYHASSGVVVATSNGKNVGGSVVGNEWTLSPIAGGVYNIKAQETGGQHPLLGTTAVRGSGTSFTEYRLLKESTPESCQLADQRQVVMGQVDSASGNLKSVYIFWLYHETANADTCNGIVGEEGSSGSWSVFRYDTMTHRASP